MMLESNLYIKTSVRLREPLFLNAKWQRGNAATPYALRSFSFSIKR